MRPREHLVLLTELLQRPLARCERRGARWSTTSGSSRPRRSRSSAGSTHSCGFATRLPRARGGRCARSGRRACALVRGTGGSQRALRVCDPLQEPGVRRRCHCRRVANPTRTRFSERHLLRLSRESYRLAAVRDDPRARTVVMVGRELQFRGRLRWASSSVSGRHHCWFGERRARWEWSPSLRLFFSERLHSGARQRRTSSPRQRFPRPHRSRRSAR